MSKKKSKKTKCPKNQNVLNQKSHQKNQNVKKNTMSKKTKCQKNQKSKCQKNNIFTYLSQRLNHIKLKYRI